MATTTQVDCRALLAPPVWQSDQSFSDLILSLPLPARPESFENGVVLDRAICEQAMLRRDSAFDGLFFVGVKTTGIYCRPVCRARLPQRHNILFFPSAAAAEIAGYRPCLRCRPETAPFSPAWNGTQTTVERALKLIAAGFLDQDSVDALGDKLGIGPRHLSRLFQQHLGASPRQVAQTLRVQRAKRLLNGTDLPIAEIARQAGFPSARRMHSSFSALYGRAPSALRQQTRRARIIRTDAGAKDASSPAPAS